MAVWNILTRLSQLCQISDCFLADEKHLAETSLWDYRYKTVQSTFQGSDLMFNYWEKEPFLTKVKCEAPGKEN